MSWREDAIGIVTDRLTYGKRKELERELAGYILHKPPVNKIPKKKCQSV